MAFCFIIYHISVKLVIFFFFFRKRFIYRKKIVTLHAEFVIVTKRLCFNKNYLILCVILSAWFCEKPKSSSYVCKWSGRT